MVYALVLGTSGAIHGGSSPLLGTVKSIHLILGVCFFAVKRKKANCFAFVRT